MKRRTLLLSAGAVLLAACTKSPVVPSASPGTAAPYAAAVAANPLRGVWPAMYKAAPPVVQTAYRYAAANEGVLRYMPCYCGCGLSAGHLDNYDCFVAETRPDGWVKLDAHGLNCGTCVAITIEVAAMRDKGMGLRAIRTVIDNRWRGTGQSTPTPLPPS